MDEEDGSWLVADYHGGVSIRERGGEREGVRMTRGKGGNDGERGGDGGGMWREGKVKVGKGGMRGRLRCLS